VLIDFQTDPLGATELTQLFLLRAYVPIHICAFHENLRAVDNCIVQAELSPVTLEDPLTEQIMHAFALGCQLALFRKEKYRRGPPILRRWCCRRVMGRLGSGPRVGTLPGP
jgi:hypothetical protein